MIDHFNLPVSDLGQSREFYEGVLATIGCRFLMTDGDAAGFGRDSWSFGIVQASAPIPSLHVAFVAPSRAAVAAFHRKAIELGARDNGGPGLRPDYDPDCYAAFAIDRDGHNIEAVFRGADL